MKNEELLDVVQQVLRGVVVSVITTDKTKAPALASALEAFATAPNLDERARIMLSDLALGAAVIGKCGATTN